MKHNSITILGDGAWGTAVATVLAHNGYQVTLWCYNEEVAHSIQHHRMNDRYLPKIKLSSAITSTQSLEVALANEIIFEAIPVQHMRGVLEQCKPYARADHHWIVLSKGIEQQTLLLPTEIIKNVLGKETISSVVSGPSYAHDLAHQQPTGVCVATTTQTLNDDIIALLKNEYLSCSPSDDVYGVQIIAALKNVIAVALGLLDGFGYSDNTQTLFLIRALQELKIIIKIAQADEATLYGLAGIGDIVLTGFGKKSRNRTVGVMLGQGKKLSTILTETGFIPEGIATLQSLRQLIETHNLSLPLFTTIHEIIFNNKKGEDLIRVLCE